MVPFIYFDLKKLVKCLLKLFVKAKVIDNCKTTFDLANVDLDKKSNFHEPINITLSFASEKILKALKKDDAIENSDAKQFGLDCRTLLKQMIKKLFERSPLKQAVVWYCRMFDPKVIASYSKEATKEALKSLLFQLLDCKLITAKFSDNVMKELEEFINNEVFLHQDKFLSFDKASQRLDVFYFQSSVNITKNTSFASMFKFVCILSHSQASVERSFNFRNVILKENLITESLHAQRIVLYHMSSNDLKPESITITEKLIKHHD